MPGPPYFKAMPQWNGAAIGAGDGWIRLSWGLVLELVEPGFIMYNSLSWPDLPAQINVDLC